MTISEFNPRIIHANHMGYLMYKDEEYKPFPPRTTRWHEIDIITFGRGIDEINGDAYQVETGDVFYRTPGMRNIHYRPYYCFFIVFDPIYNQAHESLYGIDHVGEQNDQKPTIFGNPIPYFNFATGPKIGKLNDIEPVYRVAIKLVKAWNSEKQDQIRIKSLFYELLLILREQLLAPTMMIRHSGQYQQYARQFEQLLHDIAVNPSITYTLDSMADSVKLSKNFFSTVFTSLVGETPMSYVRRIKLNHVKSLLLDTEMTVSQIARECGFDETYIYSFFRHSMNMTPIEYRRFGASDQILLKEDD